MKNTPTPNDSTRLEALARQAKDYALHMMRTTGSVPPTVIADTKDGFIFCVPAGMPDDAAKDRFAEVARLLAVAHCAHAIVMVLEAWVRMARPGGHLDTDPPPSQAPDRQEMVVLMLEEQTRCANSFLPIIRDVFGAFVEFGENPVPHFTSTAGRFSGLMPKRPQSAQEVTLAKATLHAMGMQVVNRGFDPSLN
ncbi:MAG: hypothetical protein NTW21_12370 [Verrucomicrobia bacterium]|nr:hypothetical protein [Verrucomicrobiota bacterium]